MKELLEKLVKESIEADDAFISIEKKGHKAEVNTMGSESGLLIALISLEKYILNKLNIPEEVYLTSKSLIGTKKER